MRELTGKELDAVCGGLFDLRGSPGTFYKPTPKATCVRRQSTSRAGKREYSDEVALNIGQPATIF